MQRLNFQLAFVFSLAISHLPFAIPALAGDSRSLIEQGNAAYAAGKYQEALDSYNQISDAEITLLNRAEILHDRAAAHFKLGQLEEARDLWVRAAGLRDARFEAQARYNLGNCDHAEALQAMQSGDANTALQKLGKAIDQYRDAIRLDPNLANARANLELAAQLRKQIEEQSSTQPSSNPSSQSNSDQKKKDQQQSQPSSQPQDQQNGNGQNNDQQSQPSSQPQSQPDPNQADPNQAQDPNAAQNQPQSQPDQSQSPDPNQAQSQPSEAQSQPTSASTAQTQPATSQPDSQPSLIMSPQEADRLLQMIRDAEKQRREMLRRREAAKYRPVERDW